jgi:subtilisin family serine protease
LAATAVLTGVLGTTGAGAQELEIQEPVDTKAVAESTTGSYIVVLEQDPVIAEVGQENLHTPEAEAAVEELEESHEEVLEDAGIDTSEKVNDLTIASNGFAATLTHEEALVVAGQDGVKAVLPDELRQITTDSSREFLGLTGPGEAYATGITGEGVVVGIIDTGIWPEHPSFADNGLPTPPVALEDTADNPACEFGNTTHRADDAPFTCNNKLIGARQVLPTYRSLVGAEDHEFDSARDDNGHGSHTAATAAGNEGVEATLRGLDLGVIGGVAPDAHIIAYKALGELGGFTSDLAAAVDQAVLDGVDVINYSIGGGPGLTSLDSIAFLFASDAGVAVATSVGNSGPDDATLGGPADLPWVTSVAASTQERFFSGTITLGDGTTYTGASLTSLSVEEPTGLVDAEDLGNDLCVAEAGLDRAAVEGKIVICRRGAVARVEKSLTVSEAGGVGMILYENSDAGDLFTDDHWVPTVHIDNTPGLAIKEYITTAGEPTATLVAVEKTEWTAAPTITSFSARGPNPSSSDLIKPDIAAPGHQILSAGSPVVDPGSVPDELFMSISGTSMASPHVAGVFALLTQAHPDWSPAMMKSAIMTSSSRKIKDNDRTTWADPFATGSGQLDPGRVRSQSSAFNPGLVYDAGLTDYAAFTCGADAVIFTPETCDALATSGVSLDPSDLNLASIGIGELAGAQTITRTVTNVSRATSRWHATVRPPAGFRVQVSPRWMELAPGESAEIEITITAAAWATLGEWSFGTLMWEGDAYDVRSPIAVRAVAFSGPYLVTDTGTEGSTSFDVAFGYSGTYSAQPHGLVGATITSGTVEQDPDQGFDPTDGYSQAHEFDLTDAAFFRLAIPPEATEAEADLDVYVADPSGAIVASSTAGGTNELIDIPLPADGVWTVYVHGWQTIGDDSDYDLTTWALPEAPGGGSLSVTSAPDEASIGATGTIEVSWTGLEADDLYLGAIAHGDGTDTLSFTLVEVSTGS